jgi:hypothetical protein
MEQWLLLTDYASKYRVSVSTLRRRIKAGLQAHKFEAGRYYLPDHLEAATAEAPKQMMKAAEPVPLKTSAETTPVPPAVTLAAVEAIAKSDVKLSDEPLITTTTKLLNELKQAYTLILHEKEEQIIYLKEEIADLKTLVRVLESDNARLRSPSSDFGN